MRTGRVGEHGTGSRGLEGWRVALRNGAEVAGYRDPGRSCVDFSVPGFVPEPGVCGVDVESRCPAFVGLRFNTFEEHGPVVHTLVAGTFFLD